eukprot:m.192961 g.192961  ORF g.192961 m.192961 type:complete len:218 (+) comp15661_c0_seq39:720-1373(+)
MNVSVIRIIGCGLGISFPVSDAMLERQVWSNLESCDQGIKRGNGQRKQKDGAVCVNPFHYHPAGDMTIILRPLVLTLDALGILSDAKVANILSPLKWDGKDFRNKKISASEGNRIFSKLCSCMRDMQTHKKLASRQPIAKKKSGGRKRKLSVKKTTRKRIKKDLTPSSPTPQEPTPLVQQEQQHSTPQSQRRHSVHVSFVKLLSSMKFILCFAAANT